MTNHSHSHQTSGHSHHSHTVVDASLMGSQRGIWAVKWSLVGLLITAVLQSIVVFFSGSVSLLADTLHNFGDAATAIPLWVAFKMARWKPNSKFTYGYGRVEDIAGWFVVLAILASALGALGLSIERLMHPRPIDHLGWVATASFVGFLGNEAVALFRLKVGKEIGSAALVADGHHARVDGWTSLAVLFGALGVWLGYPIADPLIGFFIALVICRVAWHSGGEMLWRTLDAIDPAIVADIRQVVEAVPGVKAVAEIRARWIGHALYSEINIVVDSSITVAAGHEIMQETHHRLLHDIRYLSAVTIHVDPVEHPGEKHLRTADHDNGHSTG